MVYFRINNPWGSHLHWFSKQGTHTAAEAQSLRTDPSSTLWGAQVSVYEFPGDSGAHWSLAQDSLGTDWGLPEGPVLRGKNARS